MKRAALVTVAILALTSSAAEARHHPRHHRHHYGHHHAHRHHGGRCDGFHACRCGVTAAHLHGLPLNYHGHNLKQAREFVRAFPRSYSPAPGNIVYQHGGGPTGHVSTIRTVLSRCEAVVADDRGTYRRDICKRGAIILAVSG